MTKVVAVGKVPTATFVILSVPSKTKIKHKRPKNKHIHVLELLMSSSSDTFSNVILPQ